MSLVKAERVDSCLTIVILVILLRALQPSPAATPPPEVVLVLPPHNCPDAVLKVKYAAPGILVKQVI